jgi:predicted molibdopterin-dependent oxidoreductase YjgC
MKALDVIEYCCERRDNVRIKNHPILEFKKQSTINFTFDGKNVEGVSGDTIASALHNLGIRKLSHSIKDKRARGFYCAIGNCASCNMIVDGVPNVRTCVVMLEEGMAVETQENKGVLYERI